MHKTRREPPNRLRPPNLQHLACHTQEDIAEAEDVDHTTAMVKIKDFVDFGKIAKIHKTHAEYLDDFDPPIYNIWPAIRRRRLQRRLNVIRGR